MQLDSSFDSGSGNTLSLIDEYKSKLSKMEKEMERKDKEIQEKSKKIAELTLQS